MKLQFKEGDAIVAKKPLHAKMTIATIMRCWPKEHCYYIKWNGMRGQYMLSGSADKNFTLLQNHPLTKIFK